jgi:hypothetical protein
LVAALDVGEHTLPGLLAGLTVRNDCLFASQDAIADLAQQLSPRRVEIELELSRQRRQHDPAQITLRLPPWQNDAFEDGDARVAQ